MNSELFIKNRKNLASSIEDNCAVLLFAGQAIKKTADEEYPFTPNRNFYYITGVDEPNVIFAMIKNSGKVEEVLFIQEPDPVAARWVGETISVDEAKEVSGVQNIMYLDGFKSFVNRQIAGRDITKIYLDLERDGFDKPVTANQEFAGELAKKYPYVSIRNIYSNICNLRSIKDAAEVEMVEKAGDITRKGVEMMMKHAKPGMMEYEIEAYFDFVLKSNGVTDYAFKTIAASGINGTVLHYSTNNTKCGENDLILCDLGAQYKYYSADITRTFPVSGKFTKRQREVYDVVLKANYEVTKIMKPGVPKSLLNQTCRKVLAEGCIKLGLIKDESELSKYYFHGVSHELGLDTHDVKNDYSVLEPGMIFTVEPGLYIPEESIGIRIEDDVLVTETGHRVLTQDMIREADEIEAFMAK